MSSNKRIFAGVMMLLSSVLISPLVAAGGDYIENAPPAAPENNLLWVVTLTAGPIWNNSTSAQTLYLQPEIEKAYTADNSNNVSADVELFIGFQYPVTTRLQAQLGLAASTTSNVDLSGDIWDDADPEFNNYSYQYQVQYTYVALKGKLLTDPQFYGLIPYLSGSAGAGFNYAHHFTNTPTIFNAIETPDFGSKTTTSFIYTAGLGVQKVLNDHWQVGIGYEFADRGKSKLARAPGQTMGEGLDLDHQYTNALLFNITWLG